MSDANRFGNGEAQASSAGFAGAGLVGAVEALKNVRQGFGGNSGAGVGDLQNGIVVASTDFDCHFSSFRRVLDGIVNQVDDHLLEAGPISFHVNSWLCLAT